jgi:hypothetical protein
LPSRIGKIQPESERYLGQFFLGLAEPKKRKGLEISLWRNFEAHYT